MNRSKIVAIITGAISIALAIAYLLIVQILDFRGEMLPAPQGQILQPDVVAVSSKWIIRKDEFVIHPSLARARSL